MSRKFSYNPDLTFIKKDHPGNLTIDGIFTNKDYKEKPDFFGVLKWILSPNPQKKEKKGDKFRVKVNKGNSFLNSPADKIVWLGHASFLIQVNGIRILTDPVFFDLPMIPRLADIPCSAEEFTDINYILLSHCHRDHLDIKTLGILVKNNPAVTFLVPLNTTKILKELKQPLKVQEAGWYQKFKTASEVEIDFLPAFHWNRRGLLDFNKELWGSFMIKWAGKSVYFAGDTSYSDHFKEIGSLYEKMGVVLMPIGAYKPHFLMDKYHANPEQAYSGFKDLKGDLFIPMHFGTYDLSNEPISEPIRKINQIFDKKNEINKLKTPSIGEEVLI